MTNLDHFYGLPWVKTTEGNNTFRDYDRFPLKVKMVSGQVAHSLNIQLFGVVIFSGFVQGDIEAAKDLKLRGEIKTKEAYDGFVVWQNAFRFPVEGEDRPGPMSSV